MNKNIKAEWVDELNKLRTAERHTFKSIFPLPFKDQENMKIIADIEQSTKLFDQERLQEQNSITNTLRAIRTKVSRLQQHTSNIEEGDNFIMILQKIIESIQKEVIQFKKWARERYDGLQFEGSQLIDDLSHFETKIDKWSGMDIQISGEGSKRPSIYERSIDIEQQRSNLKQWKEQKDLQKKMNEEKQQQEILLIQLKEKEELAKQKELLEQKKMEVYKWKESKKQKEEEERKKQLEQDKVQKLKENEKVIIYNQKLKQDLEYYQQNKNIDNETKQQQQQYIRPTPTSKAEILKRHRENMTKVEEKKKIIEEKNKQVNLYNEKMNRLLTRPSSVQVPKDPNRLIQPTKAWASKACTDEELNSNESHRKKQGAHERVVPGAFAADRFKGKSVGFDCFDIRMRAVPDWMR